MIRDLNKYKSIEFSIIGKKSNNNSSKETVKIESIHLQENVNEFILEYGWNFMNTIKIVVKLEPNDGIKLNPEEKTLEERRRALTAEPDYFYDTEMYRLLSDGSTLQYIATKDDAIEYFLSKETISQ